LSAVDNDLPPQEDTLNAAFARYRRLGRTLSGSRCRRIYQLAQMKRGEALDFRPLMPAKGMNLAGKTEGEKRYANATRDS
jgi:hypothetical protein